MNEFCLYSLSMLNTTCKVQHSCCDVKGLGDEMYWRLQIHNEGSKGHRRDECVISNLWRAMKGLMIVNYRCCGQRNATKRYI